MEGKDKKSTQRATDGFVNQFSKFLQVKSYPKVEDLEGIDLNQILYEYYVSLQSQKEEEYAVQTLKCICAGLNRHFRKTLGVDIAKDAMFVKANEMFKAIKVESKKKGKGSKNSIPPISQIDLKRIAEYFALDHVTTPNPKRLQQNIVFYIIYFFCQRGRENLYDMKKNTFSLVVNPDGTEYYIQNFDEMDKNHGVEDQERNNEGWMYATNGEIFVKMFIILRENYWQIDQVDLQVTASLCLRLDIKVHDHPISDTKIYNIY